VYTLLRYAADNLEYVVLGPDNWSVMNGSVLLAESIFTVLSRSEINKDSVGTRTQVCINRLSVFISFGELNVIHGEVGFC